MRQRMEALCCDDNDAGDDALMPVLPPIFKRIVKASGEVSKTCTAGHGNLSSHGQRGEDGEARRGKASRRRLGASAVEQHNHYGRA